MAAAAGRVVFESQVISICSFSFCFSVVDSFEVGVVRCVGHGMWMVGLWG